MKKTILTAFALMSGLTMVAIPALSSDSSGIVVNIGAVEGDVTTALQEWAGHPTEADPSCGGASAGGCCRSPATEPQCKALANSVLSGGSNATTSARKLFSCLKDDPDWDCHPDNYQGVAVMSCKTVPAMVSDALKNDIARCTSEVASLL